MRRRRLAADRPPPTDCTLCQHAESGAFSYLLCIMSVLWAGTCPHQPRGLVLGGLLAAATGRAPATPYDRHRELWVTTGERAELARMLRHVEVPRGV